MLSRHAENSHVALIGKVKYINTSKPSRKAKHDILHYNNKAHCCLLQRNSLSYWASSYNIESKHALLVNCENDDIFVFLSNKRTMLTSDTLHG